MEHIATENAITLHVHGSEWQIGGKVDEFWAIAEHLSRTIEGMAVMPAASKIAAFLVVTWCLGENHAGSEKADPILAKLARYRMVAVESNEADFGEVPSISPEIAAEGVVWKNLVKECIRDVRCRDGLHVDPEDLAAVHLHCVRDDERTTPLRSIVVDIVLIADDAVHNREGQILDRRGEELYFFVGNPREAVSEREILSLVEYREPHARRPVFQERLDEL